jgi:ComF family protein
MFVFLKERTLDLLHLFFPHLCAGCNSDLLSPKDPICPLCLASLPATRFEQLPGNPVEKIFYGRLPVLAATSTYYFTKGSRLQTLIHALKYDRNPAVGQALGRQMGKKLKASPRFFNTQCIVPLPLHKKKQQQRGYNQSAEIARGIAETTGWYLCEDALIKLQMTDTQTRKGRSERWINVRDGFAVQDTAQIAQKHLLLVDDVLTTGATLEACGNVLMQANPASMSIATLGWAG